MSEKNESRQDTGGVRTPDASNPAEGNTATKARGTARFSGWLNALGPLLALVCVIGLFAVA
ncbi:MAG TPA: hypothetical protein PLV92_18625, partial [Pirellulaceae bacterium]|nr:hypothetical protein [Pirellulaceae bacterium]